MPKISRYGNDSNLIYIRHHRYVRQYQKHMMRHVMTSHVCLRHTSFNRGDSHQAFHESVFWSWLGAERAQVYVFQSSTSSKLIDSLSHRGQNHGVRFKSSYNLGYSKLDHSSSIAMSSSRYISLLSRWACLTFSNQMSGWDSSVSPESLSSSRVF